MSNLEDKIMGESEKYKIDQRVKEAVSFAVGQDWWKDIPNVVDHRVTLALVDHYQQHIIPENPDTFCVWFDVMTADKYGKLSPSSKCYTANFGIKLDELKSRMSNPIGLYARLKFLAEKSIESLRECVRAGKDVHIAQSVDVTFTD
jgi:hypothetical protein